MRLRSFQAVRGLVPAFVAAARVHGRGLRRLASAQRRAWLARLALLRLHAQLAAAVAGDVVPAGRGPKQGRRHHLRRLVVVQRLVADDVGVAREAVLETVRRRVALVVAAPAHAVRQQLGRGVLGAARGRRGAQRAGETRGAVVAPARARLRQGLRLAR